MQKFNISSGCFHISVPYFYPKDRRAQVRGSPSEKQPCTWSCKKPTTLESRKKKQELYGINPEFREILGIMNANKTNHFLF